MAKRAYLQNLMRDLESHTEVRRFGSGWLSGFFGLLFAIAGFFMVIALRFPDWFATPELEIIKHWGGFRGVVHATLLISYGLSLLSLLLRRRIQLAGTVLRSRPLEEKIALAREFSGAVIPLFSGERVRPVMDSVYPFAEIRAAHERLESNDTFGKIVLTS